METLELIRYYEADDYLFDKFEEDITNATLTYSMEQLILTGLTSEEDMLKALQKSIQVCALTGAKINQHFKKIFVFDSKTGSIHTNWLMSKKGFNLMIIHSPLLNERIARWLWELAERN